MVLAGVAAGSSTRLAVTQPGSKARSPPDEASGFGPPNGDRYTGPRVGPQVVQCVRVGLAQGGEL